MSDTGPGPEPTAGPRAGQGAGTLAVWLRRALSVAVIAAALLQVGPAPVEAASPPVAAATDARIAGDDVRTRFILDLDAPVTFTVSKLADPYRLIIDLPSMDFRLPPLAGREGRGLIKAWRYGSFAPGKSRIVLDVREPVDLDKSFVLPAVEDQPARLVLDLVKSNHAAFMAAVEATRQAPVPMPAIPSAPKGDRLDSGGKTKPVIVLDPGHGGIDTGAVGVHGTLEKAVVMDFTSVLRRKLEASGRYSVHLTRETDIFVPLRKRALMARGLKADLFISIHADSVRSGKDVVRGATVYTLSDKASDDVAAQIAESENLSDVIAGVELSEEPAEVTDILIDLARRETKVFSIHFARTLVEELRSAVRLINNPHRSAGFVVLKAHDVPSVLIELGYLSNEHDEKLLISEEWRERTATAVAEAIDTFFQPRFAMDKPPVAAATAQ
ncbi:N-acetylmuramoyl-L-alanine amidase [Pannonibacter tanglangensis]|uniref:N-acetylmuramoyl-L-alanine amidase n=1 Tax=Pannonibacter tanglangensis TaxID=2750084 RepID=UPI003298C180